MVSVDNVCDLTSDLLEYLANRKAEPTAGTLALLQGYVASMVVVMPNSTPEEIASVTYKTVLGLSVLMLSANQELHE
jgi:hypothetical protein